MKHFLFLVPLILMTGCAEKVIEVPVAAVFNKTGDVVTEATRTIGTASSLKTMYKYRTWDGAYDSYAEMYKSAGTHIKVTSVNRTVTLNQDGKITSVSWNEPMITEVDHKDMPKFIPPADIHDYRGWQSLDNAVDKITPWGFGTWLGSNVASAMASMSEGPRNEYHGPVSMQNSQNTAGRDQIYSGPVNMDSGVRNTSAGGAGQVNEGIDEIDENGDITTYGADSGGSGSCSAAIMAIIASTPGCSGCASYLAGRCSIKP